MFWKEVDEVNGGEVDSCSITEYRTGMLAVEEDNMQNTWKDSFKYLHNVDTKERFTVNTYGFKACTRGYYFGRQEEWSGSEIGKAVGN